MDELNSDTMIEALLDEIERLADSLDRLYAAGLSRDATAIRVAAWLERAVGALERIDLAPAGSRHHR